MKIYKNEPPKRIPVIQGKIEKRSISEDRMKCVVNSAELGRITVRFQEPLDDSYSDFGVCSKITFTGISEGEKDFLAENYNHTRKPSYSVPGHSFRLIDIKDDKDEDMEY